MRAIYLASIPQMLTHSSRITRSAQQPLFSGLPDHSIKMLKSIFVSALFAASCQAVVVPQGLPDGVWSLPFDPTTRNALGEPTLLQYINAHDIPKAAVLPRQSSPPPLPNPRATCGANNLNRSNFLVVKEIFNTMCDAAQQYRPNQAIVMTAGTSIAYMCNFNGTNRCWRQEYDEAMALLDRNCGQDRVGTVYVERWVKTYGRDNAGANICL
jgi:hypothetical protein